MKGQLELERQHLFFNKINSILDHGNEFRIFLISCETDIYVRSLSLLN